MPGRGLFAETWVNNSGAAASERLELMLFYQADDATNQNRMIVDFSRDQIWLAPTPV